MIEMPEWQRLTGSAIVRKHRGDIDGAIVELLEAINLTRTVLKLFDQTEISLQTLADLYLTKNLIGLAEETIRDAIKIARPRRSFYLGDHLLILAEILKLKGEFRDALASAQEASRMHQRNNHAHGVMVANELIERLKSMS